MDGSLRERMASYYKLSTRPKLTIITCILPVKCSEIKNDLKKSDDKASSEYKCSLFVDELCIGINSLRPNFKIQWVGWPRIRMPDEKTKESVRTMLSLAPMKMIPVFMTDEEIESHMSGFCRKVVWNNFHNMPHPSSPFVNKVHLITSYEAVNRKFAKVALETKADIYWIMGHELMLIPQMIREAVSDAKIGFFLHIPFPVEYHFFTMPNRRQVLEGILGADLVGFQTYDFFRSFISCVYHLMGKVCNLRKLEVNERVVTVDEYPMGVDYDYFISDQLQDDEDRVGKLRNEFDASQHSCITSPEDRTTNGEEKSKDPLARLIEQVETMEIKQDLIISSDRLDDSSEIVIRISAYRLFLEKNPQFKTRVVLLLLVQPPLFPSEAFNNVRDEINQMVTNLNGNLGSICWQPIVYLYGNLTLPSIKRLLLRANVCLSVPLKSGMGLLAKEYVVTRNKSKTGVLILSENTGAAKELSESIIVNPYDISAMADAIAKALEMPLQEQAQRLNLMLERLHRNDVCQWANSFVNGINEAHQVSIKARTQRLAGITYIQVVTAYRKAMNNRLLLFDYDGTLSELAETDRAPDSEIMHILNTLASDSRNVIVINSGRDKDTLEQWFKNVNVDISAEHGVWVRKKGCWSKAIEINDMWKSEVMNTIEYLFDSIQGIEMIVTDYSIQLIVSDKSLNNHSLIEQLRDRAETLRSLIGSNPDVRIIESSRRLEVKSAIISKGRAVLNWMNSTDASYDFILSLGDDYTDEDMFRELPEHSITIKVGITSTEAKYYLMNTFDVRMFLRDLIR